MPDHRAHPRFPRPAALALLVAVLAPSAGADPPSGAAPKPADPRWLERIGKLDRTLLDEGVGVAPPAFTPDLTWVGTERETWADLRGRVVVIQSWTSATPAGRRTPARVERLLSDFDAKDVKIILLHTPEGREKIQKFLDRRPLEPTVIVDTQGVFCDRLGIYRRPVNIVVDRDGVTRYAGLNNRGLAPAVAGLIDEPHDPNTTPPTPRTVAGSSTAEFPPTTGEIDKAIDFRGRTAPDFTIESWWTERPEAKGKVIVLDFWATWCGPCVASIPHMNALADGFPREVCIIGISREPSSKFESGMARIRQKHEFRYALALDPAGTMQRAIGITAIPHCVVISSDWTVRWQGHPAGLTAETLGQIVRADGRGPGGAEDPRRFRWTGRQ